MTGENRDILDIINAAISQEMANLHTCTIAKVTRVNDKTINCKPVINRVVDGESIELPEFVDVPPIFMNGGDSYQAFPVEVGDYALLIFTERASDEWYDGNDFKSPIEQRMHDYSDGFALVGLNPKSDSFEIPDRIARIGDVFEEGDHEHIGDKTQEGDFDLTGNQTIDGNLTIDGSLIVNGGAGTSVSINGVTFTVSGGDIQADGVSLKQHTHPDTTSGGNTGSPNT